MPLCNSNTAINMYCVLLSYIPNGAPENDSVVCRNMKVWAHLTRSFSEIKATELRSRRFLEDLRGNGERQISEGRNWPYDRLGRREGGGPGEMDATSCLPQLKGFVGINSHCCAALLNRLSKNFGKERI